MNVSLKRVGVAAVAAFVTSNMLTTAYYMATATANTVSFAREAPVYGLLMASHLVFAAISAYLLAHLIRDERARSQGAKFGALLGALMFVPTGLVVRGIWQVDVNPIFAANSVAHIAIGAVCGLVIGAIYRAQVVGPAPALEAKQ